MLGTSCECRKFWLSFYMSILKSTTTTYIFTPFLLHLMGSFNHQCHRYHEKSIKYYISKLNVYFCHLIVDSLSGLAVPPNSCPISMVRGKWSQDTNSCSICPLGSVRDSVWPVTSLWGNPTQSISIEVWPHFPSSTTTAIFILCKIEQADKPGSIRIISSDMELAFNSLNIKISLNKLMNAPLHYFRDRVRLFWLNIYFCSNRS